MGAFRREGEDSFGDKHTGVVRHAPLWNFPNRFAGNPEETNRHVSPRVADHQSPLASDAHIGMKRQYRTDVRLERAVSSSNINLAESEIAGDSGCDCAQALGDRKPRFSAID